MAKSVLFGRCKCDADVRFPYYWLGEIVKKFDGVGDINIIDLQTKNFIEKKFNKLVDALNPEIIICGGHGKEYAALGYKERDVIIANKNDYKLSGRYAYVMSCFTASVLGLSAFNKGCNGYVGYKSRFVFFHSKNVPAEDEISKIFMEASNIIAETLIRGGTPKEAYENAQNVYDKWLRVFSGKFYDPAESPKSKATFRRILGALITNQQGLTYFWKSS